MNLNGEMPITVWCRIKGLNGKSRELKGLIDFNYQFCLMPRQDAMDLGYSDASQRHKGWYETRPDRAPLVLTFRGIERTIQINLKEIVVGRLVAKDVDTVVLEYDPPSLSPIDVILGWSFLQNFRITVDPKSKFLSLD
jgi:predicted aspartyl protease